MEKVTGTTYTDPGFPKTPQELSHIILHTCYMGSANSSASTRRLSSSLADEIGAYHLTISIDAVIQAFLSVFQLVVGCTPQYLSHGGTSSEDLALQVIKLYYFFFCSINVIPTSTDRESSDFNSQLCK